MFLVRAYLWIAPNFLLLLALWGIFHRKRQAQHPLFVAYLVLQLAYFLATFTVDFVGRHSPSRTTYLWVLVVGLGLSALLELAALYELTAELIFSRLRTVSALKTVFRWTMGLVVLVAVVVSASLGWSSPERLTNVFQSVNVIVYLIALALLFGIILLTKALSVPWRSLHAGIALGFGITAAGELAGSGVLSQFGRSKSGYIAADLVRMSAFHLCALIWLIYAFLPEKRPSGSARALSVTELESRTQELQRLVRR